jgi:hypothetical protein
MKERRDEGADTNAVCSDAAVRAIGHQLAFLLNTSAMDEQCIYGEIMEECEKKSA